MPLMKGKSDEAFKQNVRTEMHEGKPLKQSLAIAYAMKRKAKNMAKGGMASNDVDMDDSSEDSAGKKISDSFKSVYSEGGHVCKACGYAEGGFVDEENASGYHDMPMENPEHMVGHEVPNQSFDEEDMLDGIMRSHAKGYSEGGKVANNTHEGTSADMQPNEFDELVKDDDLEFNYTGANSGDEDGDAKVDKDDADTLDQVMKSRKKKDKNPRPA